MTDADKKHMTEAEIVEGLAEALFNDAMDSVDRVLRWKDGGAARPEALRRAARVAIAYLASIGQPSAVGRIASAPKGWEIQNYLGGARTIYFAGHVSVEELRAIAKRNGCELVPIALVPLTPEEAGE